MDKHLQPRTRARNEPVRQTMDAAVGECSRRGRVELEATFINPLTGYNQSTACATQGVVMEPEAYQPFLLRRHPKTHGRTPSRVWFLRALRKEAIFALLLGGTCGLTVALVAWLWRGQPAAALVIGGSITLSMLLACLIGLTVPTVLHRFKLDPKIAAGPVSLALADLSTLRIYLSVATATLR